jgi:hypothetical protein
MRDLLHDLLERFDAALEVEFDDDPLLATPAPVEPRDHSRRESSRSKNSKKPS